MSCTFRKEIKPYQPYEIWSRILSWDHKWLYIVSHFVRKDAVKPTTHTLYPWQKPGESTTSVARKEDAIFASALSKCVWKKGRQTVPPEIMLQVSGLLPPKPGDISPLNPELPSVRSLQGEVEEYLDIPFKAAEKLGAAWESVETSLFPLAIKHQSALSKEPQTYQPQDWTWERMENERKRGMEMATLLAGLDRLDREFTADSEALGMHSDM